MIKKRLKKILAERLGEIDDFNVIKFDLDEDEIDAVIDEASLLPLGYDRKAVVVDNASFLTNGGKKEDKEKIFNLLQSSGDEVDLIFIYHGDSVDNKSDIYKFVEQNGQVLNFMNITKEEWPLYVKKYFKDRNVEIDPKAVDELVTRVDGDLLRFINEADKLCLYKNKISVMDVALMVSKPLEDDVFQISNALLRGDNAAALSIFRDLKMINSKATESLISLLGNQFRFINQVMFLSSKGLDKKEIAFELGASEGRVWVTQKNTRNLSRRDVAHALDDLYYLDYQIKSGQIDRFYGFELFLINFPN